jgi:hypothetical protein
MHQIPMWTTESGEISVRIFLIPHRWFAPRLSTSEFALVWRTVLLSSACTCVHAVSTHVHTPYIYAYVIFIGGHR